MRGALESPSPDLRQRPPPSCGPLPKAGAHLLLPTCEETDEGRHKIVLPGPRKELRRKGYHDESGEERQDDGGQQGDSAEDDVNCRGGQEGEQAGPPHSAQRAQARQPQVPKRGLGPKFQPRNGQTTHH